MAEAETPRQPSVITPMSTAKQVREEMSRATGQPLWCQNEYWNYYLKGRRELFDSIYDEIPDKDWQNPAVASLVEQRYVELAYERWAGPDDAWVLEGEWLRKRPDILSWMRTIYWKHNKLRRIKLQEETGSVDADAWRPYHISRPPKGAEAGGAGSSAASPPPRDADAERADTRTSGGEGSNASNWKDVMLR